MLRQLGNSFIVQPEVLKSYITESYLGRIDVRLLRPYLMQRSDWATFARQFNISDEDTITINGPSESTSASHTTGKGFLRTSRISMNIGSAGLGKLKDVLKDIDAHPFDEEKSQGSRKQTPRSPRTLAKQRLTGKQVAHSPSYNVLPTH
jgi:exocyst complex component 5